jgi:hypothetical protein
MRIFTFSSGSEELPENERAIARIKHVMPSGFGKTRANREEWHPVIIYAATQAEAAAKAQAWWDGEVEKARAKAAEGERRAQMMRDRHAKARDASTASPADRPVTDPGRTT